MGDPPDDWSPAATAHFPSKEARTRFLFAVAYAVDRPWSAEPMLDDDRGALVRWRHGGFLRLNDLAYAHGGRIVASSHRYWW